MADLPRFGATESDTDPAFVRIARVAARALNAPIALISLFDGEQRSRTWSVGCEVARVEAGDELSFTWELLPASDRRPPNPLTLTASSRQPGISPRHLSSPMRIGDEPSAGVICAAVWEPRTWTEEETDSLKEIAAIAMSEIELRRVRAALRSAEARWERAEQMKQQFASALRHEFGQPLTVIQGFSELMSEGDLAPAEIREYAQEINKEAASLSEIVSRIRDMDQKIEEFAASRRSRKPWPESSS